MRLFKFVRANDWWEPKLPPLLMAAYATAIIEGVDLLTIFPELLFLIVIFAVVAVYVSLINDYADVQDDRISGKNNRLENISPLSRRIFVISSVTLGILLIYFLKESMVSVVFALGGVACFTLYSLPPFRLKNRKSLGIIADASGSHLFPSLFFVSSAYYFMDLEINFVWLTVVGIWAFAHGLRGILHHQYQDKPHDIQVDLRTFATSGDSLNVKPIFLIIFLIEIIALGIVFYNINSIIPLLALAIYSALLFVYMNLGKEIIIAVPSAGKNYILMSDYYQVLLPYSLILLASLNNPACLLLFIFHLFMFPVRIRRIAVNLLKWMGLKKVFAR